MIVRIGLGLLAWMMLAAAAPANTPTRLIVEKESHAVSPGYRAFHVYLPLKTGRCHAGIGFKTSTPEEVVKRIATSVTLIK